MERTFEELLDEAGTVKPESSVRLPEEIHPEMSSYKEITVSIDKKSLTFSYEYPKLLEDRVPLREYRFFISKLNQIITPEAVCYNLNAVLRIFFLPLLLVLVAMTASVFAFCLELEEEWNWSVQNGVCLAVCLASIILFSIVMYRGEILYKNPLHIRKTMSSVIENMCKRYWSTKTVFEIG